jgi:hypothetical protein
MTIDDEAARKARAKRLHDEIDRLAGKTPPAAPVEALPTEDSPAPPAAESPREFVHRRMRELKGKEKRPS